MILFCQRAASRQHMWVSAIPVLGFITTHTKASQEKPLPNCMQDNCQKLEQTLSSIKTRNKRNRYWERWAKAVFIYRLHNFPCRNPMWTKERGIKLMREFKNVTQPRNHKNWSLLFMAQITHRLPQWWKDPWIPLRPRLGNTSEEAKGSKKDWQPGNVVVFLENINVPPNWYIVRGRAPPDIFLTT